MKIKKVSMTRQFLCGLVTKGVIHYFKIIRGIPADAVMIDCHYNHQIHCLDLIFEHPSFDDLPEGSTLYAWNVELSNDLNREVT